MRIILIALLVAGCAPSLADIREYEPRRMVVTAQTYDRVALCILDALDRRDPGMWSAPSTQRYVDRREEQRASIVIMVDRGMMTPAPATEFTAAQAGPDVVVEARGYGLLAPDKIWPLVESCGRRLSWWPAIG